MGHPARPTAIVDAREDATSFTRNLVMRKLTKAAGLLLLAASSVYSDGVLAQPV